MIRITWCQLLLLMSCFGIYSFAEIQSDLSLAPPVSLLAGSEDNWVHSTAQSALPANAVYGGYDTDKSPLYVGRAYHAGGLLPAKVSPSKGFAAVANYGKEHKKSNYDVLVGDGYSWVPDSHGHVPPNAVASGRNSGGELLYVGRGMYSNSLVVGKVHPAYGCLFVPFAGKERNMKYYEVLVRN